MSRQFDQSFESKFELYGELYSFVEPRSIEELIEALRVKSFIQEGINGLPHDEDPSVLYEALQKQEDNIQVFLDSLGEFDNRNLVNNIICLTKKYGMRIGDLEKNLGISAGYISRTAKENSQKKMSVDTVWKIARLFDVDIRTIIETDLQIPNNNTDLLAKFIQKLNRETQEGIIEWTSHGGVMTVLNERYKEMGLISEESDIDTPVYHPTHLNHDMRWLLTDDIWVCENFQKNKDLAIIPYELDDELGCTGFDFLLVWTDGDVYHWEKVFYTSDDPFGTLEKHASILYKGIQDTEFDAKISPEIRGFILDYLN